MVLVLVGWAALVVLSSAPEVADDAFFSPPDLRAVIVSLLAVIALAGLIMLPFLFRGDNESIERPPRKSMFSFVIMIALIVFVLMAINPQLPQEIEAEPEVGGAPLQQDLAEPTDFTPAELGNLGLLLTACLGIGALLLWTRSRLRTELDQGLMKDNQEADLAVALENASNLLASSGDPRDAVLASYSSLETALADQGRPRLASETPTEHLRRVLERFPSVAGPAVRLGALYEIARFSEHPISVEDQHDAGDALRESRIGLRKESTAT